MQWLIITGAIISLIGLIGLLICIMKALQIRREGGSDDEMRAKLQPLVALNFGALAFSVIGLMCVMIGVLL